MVIISAICEIWQTLQFRHTSLQKYLYGCHVNRYGRKKSSLSIKHKLDIKLSFYDALKMISENWFFFHFSIWKTYLEWYTSALGGWGGVEYLNKGVHSTYRCICLNLSDFSSGFCRIPMLGGIFRMDCSRSFYIIRSKYAHKTNSMCTVFYPWYKIHCSWKPVLYCRSLLRWEESSIKTVQGGGHM